MAYTIVETSNGRDTYPAPKTRSILVDSESDLASIPEDTAPGSTAYTADMTQMWMLDNSGVWKRIGG